LDTCFHIDSSISAGGGNKKKPPENRTAAPLALIGRKKDNRSSYTVITLTFSLGKTVFARKRFFHVRTIRTIHPPKHRLIDAACPFSASSLSTWRDACSQVVKIPARSTAAGGVFLFRKIIVKSPDLGFKEKQPENRFRLPEGE